ncbi:DUF6970 domain-containing protein [Polaribacter sp. Hel1_85]|uniref:DUF6970 domain-containing protein n=1 Tax=Polaribacter sp. Hel1_85 TaxID=1250005 RepID=UPI00052C7403|nr:hypothetical protein [Polaribacter sp. Hel1_85]KGL62541.1 hypothetical protein PHEL85_2335 [Polaribacter sp. Hel1_85]
MKLKTIFLLLIFVVFSCNDKNEVSLVCGVENPIEELAFLNEIKNNIDRIDCAGKSAIIQYIYKSEIVFEVNICDQIADGQTSVYNCSGEVVCTFGGIAGVNTCPDFDKLRTDKIILYGN